MSILRDLKRRARAYVQYPFSRLAVRRQEHPRFIIGAADAQQRGWIPTDACTLDVTSPRDWKRMLGERSASALLAEHVWEHLDERATDAANLNCFRILKPGGYLRLAVPDGLHPDPDYIEHVRPGGIGAGADDHKILYTHATLTSSLQRAGFQVQPLEWWDEQGQFNYRDWSAEDGFIHRSSRNDKRNAGGKLKYTSLIVDARKPE